MGTGVVALGIYGFVATLQPDAQFGRILAAYGGIFVAGPCSGECPWTASAPDRWDITGAVIMYAPPWRLIRAQFNCPARTVL